MKVIIKCSRCETEFEREKKRIDSNNRTHSKNYCSTKCQYLSNQELRSDEFTPYRYMHTQASNRAIYKQKEFQISLEDIRSLWIEQDGRCRFTGEELIIEGSDYEKKHGKTTASLDRIDSKNGYLPDNIQIIHKDLQGMKKDLDDDVFIYWSHRVAQYCPYPENPFDKSEPQPYNGDVNVELPF